MRVGCKIKLLFHEHDALEHLRQQKYLVTAIQQRAVFPAGHSSHLVHERVFERRDFVSLLHFVSNEGFSPFQTLPGFSILGQKLRNGLWRWSFAFLVTPLDQPRQTLNEKHNREEHLWSALKVKAPLVVHKLFSKERLAAREQLEDHHWQHPLPSCPGLVGTCHSVRDAHAELLSSPGIVVLTETSPSRTASTSSSRLAQ